MKFPSTHVYQCHKVVVFGDVSATHEKKAKVMWVGGASSERNHCVSSGGIAIENITQSLLQYLEHRQVWLIPTPCMASRVILCCVFVNLTGTNAGVFRGHSRWDACGSQSGEDGWSGLPGDHALDSFQVGGLGGGGIPVLCRGGISMISE